MDFRHFPGCEVSQNPTDRLAMIRVGVLSILYLMGGIDEARIEILGLGCVVS